MSPMLLIIIGAAVLGGLAFVFLGGESDVERRMKMVAGEKPRAKKLDVRTALFGADETRDVRRRQVQESVQQIEERARKSQRKRSLQDLVDLAGLEIPPRQIQILCGAVGAALALGAWFVGVPIFVAALLVVIGVLALPRWLLGALIKRRQRKFLELFPDGIDIMVRAIRTGLPVQDAMRMIASESPAPVGPEFLELVEAQRLGLTVEQALERMCERIELPEINFLAIVMNIQAKSGGNLSEALSNLSRVLRERRKMRGKIKAISQEAVSSAAIIGSLPVVLVAVLAIASPDYLTPLIETRMGNMIIIGCLVWMGIGTFIMRAMIKMDI